MNLRPLIILPLIPLGLLFAQGQPPPAPVPPADRLNVADLVTVARESPVRLWLVSGTVLEGRVLTADEARITVATREGIVALRAAAVDAVLRREMKDE